MDHFQKKNSNNSSAPNVDIFASIAHALAESTGRYGVRIFGASREQIIMASISTFLFIGPMLIFVSLIPFWDQIGGFTPLQRLNSFVAPAIEAAYEHQGEPRSSKRILISSLSLIELLLLSKFVALCARGVRKHALLVWIGYDRAKLLRYFGISAVVFFGLWYVLFFNWRILEFVDCRGCGRPRATFFCALAMPFATFIFGHMAAIVALGGWRTLSRKMRRFVRPLKKLA